MINTSDYYNVYNVLKYKKAFNFFIGGRGIGKTYSALSLPLENKDFRKFLYLRNTEKQLAISQTELGNPFKKINSDKQLNIKFETIQDMSYIKSDEQTIIGYGAALSTFKNLRGIDLSDVNYIIFDEFIEKRKLSYDQFDAFCHCYETINRNRELYGEPPVIVALLSNAQNIASPILAGFNLITEIESMRNGGKNLKIKQNYTISLPSGGRVRQEKYNTALYQMTRGTAFEDESLNNNFAYNDFYGVTYRPLKNYKCICGVNNVYIYAEKNGNRFYCCRSRDSNVPFYNTKQTSILFMRAVGLAIRDAIARGMCEFSDYQVKCEIFQALGLM